MKHVSAYRGAGLNPNRVTKKKPADRVSAYATEEKNRGGLIEGTGYVTGRLGLGIAGVGEGVLDIAAAGGDILRGDTEMAKYRFLDNRTADSQQSLTEWYNPGKGMQFAGDVASGIGQSSVFLLDALVPGLGTGLFFGGITGQSVAGAAQQTGDVGLKEIGYGVASGAAEAALGKLVGAGGKVAGKLGSSLTRSTGKAVGQRGITNALTKATGKRLAGMGWNVAQNTLADAAGEFTEEFTAEYIDTGLQRLFGIDPNASTSFGEALRAGAVGFVSGAAMGAPANVYNYKNSVAAGRAIREEGGVDQLLYRAAATVDVLKEQEAQAREKGRTKATVPEDAGLVGKTAAKGKQAVANLGAKTTASKTKGYWTKLEKNINAYTSMDEAMRNSDVGDALLGELRGNLFFTNMSYAVEEAEEALKTATDEQITEWLIEVNDKAKKAGKADASYTVEDFRANKDGILSTVAAAFWIDEIRRAAKGTEDAEKATEKPAEAATSPWDGMTDHEDMSGYKAAGEAENALLKAAVKESVPRGSVQTMLDEFRKGTDMTPEEFAAAWSDGVHIYGRYGFDVGEESPLSRMSPEAREAAMKFGRETEEAERKAAEEKAKAKKKPAAQAGKKGTVVRGKGLEIKTLSDDQYAAYKAAEVLAEVLGTEIVIETAITDKKGRTVNGYYDTKTNRLHVNINALRDGKNISLYTLGHEVTHYIKEWSPTKFEALADFVLDQMGVDAETAVAEKLASLKRLGIVTDTMTVAEANALAREELVAEGMELVLTDGKVLEELAKTDKSLWEKIRDWIADVIDKIRKHYGELNQASKTAQVLKETVESLEEIERLFTEGVREAGERTRTAEVETVTRMNEENMHDSDRVYSNGEIDSRTFDYNEIVAKDDLLGVVIDKKHQVPLQADGNIDKKAMLKIVRNKCESVEMKGGAITYYVNVPDIGRSVRMTSDGITHGFKAKKDNPNGMTTARATLELPEILKNSIEVNRLKPRGNIDIPFSRVLMGTVGMEDNNGKIEYYAVRSVVEERINQDPVLVKTEILGNLLGSNAKKITAAGLRGVKTNVALSPFRGYSYNIAHFLDDVKGVFKNTFSNDVYQTLGVQREQDDFANDLLYSIDETSDDAYLSAIERGDMETAQKMVDEAAKKAGWNPVVRYHQTGTRFSEFSNENPDAGLNDSDTPNGYFFKENDHDIGVGADFVKTGHGGSIQMRVYLRHGRLLYFKDRDEARAWYSKNIKGYKELLDKYDAHLEDFKRFNSENNAKMFDELIALEESGQSTSERDLAIMEKYDKIADDWIENNKNYETGLRSGMRRILNDYFIENDSGYDGIELADDGHRYIDGKREDVHTFIVFKNTQIKSADPVTYDDNGNVIPLSERFKEDDSDIRYSIDETPETRDLTDREILGMALEGAVQSQEEYNIVKSYREQAAMLELVREKRDGYIKEANALERQIKALRARMEDEGDPDGWIRKAMDDAIAKKREAERMRDEQVKILDNADRELLRMKATKPFREILAREQKRVRAAEYKAQRAEETAEKARETTKRVREEYKEKIYKARREATDYKRAVYRTAYEKAEEKNRAYRERTDRKADESRERKEMTARKRTIMRVLGGLQTKLVHPTKTNHAPKELHDLVQTVMRTADPKAWDTNRKNIREMGDLAADIEKLERRATRTAKEQEWLDAMKSKYETIEQQTMPLAKQAQAMYAAYKQYNDTLPEDMKIPESVMAEMSKMIAKIEDVPLKKMGLESLKAVETFVKVLSYQINNANELFVRKRGEQVSDWGNAASREAAESKPLKWLSPKSMEIKNARDVRDFLWKNMKPLTAFEAIGSPKLMELFKSVLDGEEVWITDVLEAREAIVKAKEQYGYDTWDLKTRREFTNGEGKTVRLTVGEMMSLYAYAKREQAMGHLRGGGFVLDAGATEITEKNKIRTEKMLNLTERYTMTEEDMGKLAGMLTEEQKQYATEIQDYLTSLGEKGNEISRKLYGLDLFNEKYYFPIKVKSEYLESQTGKTGDPKIKNRGMSKETVPDAQNPLVLQDFMTIVSGHVNDMATYHAFVLPVEDLTRVLNYQPSNAIIDEDGNWTEDKERKEYSTLKAVIESKYGAQANAYIEQLIRDLNGGARREAAANLIDKGITAFKRASTMASLSVLVQQPTSVFRAMAYIDPKHFRSLAALDIKGHKEAWEQVKKYAKVAAIKEMGGYDTGVGTRTADYLNSKDYKTWGERAKAFFLPDVYGGDSNYRAEIFGKGAAYADELAWIQMFDACKREQAEKLGKPMDSEEVLEAAGKRFTEVVRRTQVYDSTLTRSEYMRSKDTGMKMATAFMAEPTTVVSMMLDGLIRANRGNKAFLKKTAGAIAASVIFNALAVSLIYAARDDDEEKTYTEKYLATLATETAEGFNPLEYLPYTRDVMSLMKGYDIERTDMALFADLFKSLERITSSTRTPVEKTTEVAGAVASFFGVPIRNLVRDAMIPVNLVQSATSGERTTGKGISAAIADEFSIITNLFGADTTNAHELYKAAKSGDDAHYNRVASRYKSEQAAEMALRTALRENDKRIAEAAEAKISGELEAYESIIEKIESEGRFDRNLIIRAINNEVLDIKDNADQVVIPEEEVTDDEEETAEPLYSTSDLNDALTRGDREDFEDIYYYLLATKQEQGKTEAQAKAAVKSGITSYWKKQYLAAWETNNTAEMKRILELLEGTELYGEYNDVATMASKWIKES